MSHFQPISPLFSTVVFALPFASPPQFPLVFLHLTHSLSILIIQYKIAGVVVTQGYQTCTRTYQAAPTLTAWIRSEKRRSRSDILVHTIFILNDLGHSSAVHFSLTFKSRIKSHLPFESIIRSSSYSTSFQDKG